MKKQTKKLIPMRIRMLMNNDINLYSKNIPNWENISLKEQNRCMSVNRFRVESEGLHPISLPDWEL